jgi:hypothetical protein
MSEDLSSAADISSSTKERSAASTTARNASCGFSHNSPMIWAPAGSTTRRIVVSATQVPLAGG